MSLCTCRFYNFCKIFHRRDLSAAGAVISVTPGAKAVSEGAVAAVTLVNHTIDIAANGRLFNALGSGGLFSAVSGGKSRYSTGSHVDCKEFSL
ncbi:MAG: hypothetical protein LBI56_02255, partial [Puniceicoccales bacterium]|nr:hypothetical protein [Puniceicoccales bacterium]